MSELSAAAVALIESLRIPDPPKDSFTAADFAKIAGLTARGAMLRLESAKLQSAICRAPSGRPTRYYWK